MERYIEAKEYDPERGWQYVLVRLIRPCVFIHLPAFPYDGLKPNARPFLPRVL